ncbi:hypothetical protein K788_0005214 [Paraburkholderia caribensis MBA4]|uniref:Uncharacterized protein n=1 Tax=Paraburkholderia caribensis MBA4 TaxID=1323664 RepID=A0A0P0RF58_9BURK|nr:hypothetical protein K788_0005214 [Paraburkholderia caribensis MBA4]
MTGEKKPLLKLTQTKTSAENARPDTFFGNSTRAQIAAPRALSLVGQGFWPIDRKFK